MDVEEMNVGDLFEDEAHDQDDDGRDEDDGDHDDYAERSEAQLELGGKPEGQSTEAEKPKKRIIRNPQPKLDPDRILGVRGVPILEKVFEDFKPKGKGEEFRDLDRMMKKMEHWAHRLYPKLPFDDVMNRISVLGKKKTVQVNLKKIRMGMATFVEKQDSEDEEAKVQNPVDNRDTTQRYDDQIPEDDDIFDQLMGPIDDGPGQSVEPQRQSQSHTLSDEQKERMIRNRQMAEEKRKARLLEKQRQEEASAMNGDAEQSLGSQGAAGSNKNEQSSTIVAGGDDPTADPDGALNSVSVESSQAKDEEKFEADGSDKIPENQFPSDDEMLDQR